MIPNKIILEITNEAEKLFPVDLWKVENIHFWPWIRALLMRQTRLDFGLKEKKVPFLLSFYNKIINALRYRFMKVKRLLRYDLILKNHRKTKADAEVFFQSFSNKRELLNGVLYDRHCDPLIDYLKKINIKSLLLEQNDTLLIDNSKKQNEEGCVSSDSLIYDYLKNKQNRLEDTSNLKIELPEYENFLEFLKTKLPQIKMGNFHKASICKDMNKILVLKEFFLEILKNNKRVKACFLVSYYHMPGMALILACKESGIPTIDLQHGCQYHMAYSKWTKVPKNGYEMLP